MKQAANIGLFKGFQLNVRISYNLVQFVDDTILVGDGSWSNFWAIKSILRGYQMISGLRINMWNSKIYGIGLREHFLQTASYFLSCKIDNIPFKLLGIMVGSNPRRYETWKPILSIFRVKLANWKGRFLSIVGRATLIKSVINNLPMHHLSFFKAPVKCKTLSIYY